VPIARLAAAHAALRQQPVVKIRRTPRGAKAEPLLAESARIITQERDHVCATGGLSARVNDFWPRTQAEPRHEKKLTLPDYH